jgi:hypothetical protein
MQTNCEAAKLHLLPSSSSQIVQEEYNRAQESCQLTFQLLVSLACHATQRRLEGRTTIYCSQRLGQHSTVRFRRSLVLLPETQLSLSLHPCYLTS